MMIEMFGPWVDHDGKGCPLLPGTAFQAVDLSCGGWPMIFDGIAWSGGGYSWDWRYQTTFVPGTLIFASQIIRYRIKKPAGLKILEAVLRERVLLDLDEEVPG